MFYHMHFEYPETFAILFTYKSRSLNLDVHVIEHEIQLSRKILFRISRSKLWQIPTLTLITLVISSPEEHASTLAILHARWFDFSLPCSVRSRFFFLPCPSKEDVEKWAGWRLWLRAGEQRRDETDGRRATGGGGGWWWWARVED